MRLFDLDHRPPTVFLWFADLGYSDGEAVELGVVDATAVQVDVSFCGGA